MKLIIQEFVRREMYASTEFPGENFKELTELLVNDLRNTATVKYSASVLTKWFGGQHFADSVPGDEKPFDIREYDGPVGTWTDYLFRL